MTKCERRSAKNCNNEKYVVPGRKKVYDLEIDIRLENNEIKCNHCIFSTNDNYLKDSENQIRTSNFVNTKVRKVKFT